MYTGGLQHHQGISLQKHYRSEVLGREIQNPARYTTQSAILSRTSIQERERTLPRSMLCTVVGGRLREAGWPRLH